MKTNSDDSKGRKMLVSNAIGANEDLSILFNALSYIPAEFPSVLLENTKADIVAVQFSHTYTKQKNTQILLR